MSEEQARDDHGRFAEMGSDAHAAGVTANTRQGRALRAEADVHEASALAHSDAATRHHIAGNAKKAAAHLGHAEDAREAAKRVRETFERLKDRIKETGEKGIEAADTIAEVDSLEAGKVAMKTTLARASFVFN